MSERVDEITEVLRQCDSETRCGVLYLRAQEFEGRSASVVVVLEYLLDDPRVAPLALLQDALRCLGLSLRPTTSDGTP